MNIHDVIKEYCKTYYVEDTSLIAVTLATVLANKMPGPPVWVMLIGGSSSGKSEIIRAVSKVSFAKEISMLTTNTFLSGMPSTDGHPTSLLNQIGQRGVLLMKDFTTILSMRKETSAEIMAQLREIYDGHLNKMTGTGKNLHWEGKLNLVAGVTEKLFVMDGEFAEMGTRAINFIIEEQDRVKTTKRSAQNVKTIDEKRLHLQNIFTEYIQEMSDTIASGDEIIIPDAVEDKIIEVCDFSSYARSTVHKDYRGNITLVLSPEMPMRMSDQLQQLARCFIAMGYEENFDKIMYKMSLDCIPKGRRIVLKELAGHNFVTTGGLRYKLRYSEETIRGWLEELHSLRFVECERNGGRTGDKWTPTEKTRKFMAKYENVVDSGLELTEESEVEIKAKSQAEFDGF